MKPILKSLDLWSTLSLFTLLAGLVAQEADSKYFNLTVSGVLIITFGSILCLISFLNGPRKGALAEISINQRGEHAAFVPGEEYNNHNFWGVIIVIIGTLLTATSALV